MCTVLLPPGVNPIAFLVNETNRCTEFQFFIGNNNSTCFGQSFCPSSGASQPNNGTGAVYAARRSSATSIIAVNKYIVYEIQVVMYHTKCVTYWNHFHSQVLFLFPCVIGVCTQIIFVVVSDPRFCMSPVMLQLKLITFAFYLPCYFTRLVDMFVVQKSFVWRLLTVTMLVISTSRSLT
jgi:hypothetical protein